MLTAGKRDRRIQVLRHTTAQDSTGAISKAWAPLFKLWAAAHDRTGRETLTAAQAEVAAWDIRFTVLYSSDLQRTDRIAYRSDIYRIVHIDELGRRDGMVLLCTRELQP